MDVLCTRLGRGHSALMQRGRARLGLGGSGGGDGLGYGGRSSQKRNEGKICRIDCVRRIRGQERPDEIADLVTCELGLLLPLRKLRL